jgi:hypothetical protein
MTKKVLAMDIGYNYYTSNGDLVGYKSLFRVEMNNEQCAEGIPSGNNEKEIKTKR